MSNEYTVKEGDTLWDIAKKHNVSLPELIKANPQIKDPNLIYPGDKVIIPNTSLRTISQVRKIIESCFLDINGCLIIKRKVWGEKAVNYSKMEPDSDYDTIVIHHSGNGGAKDPKKIEKKHMEENKWDDVGYHFLITPDGTGYEGRRLGYKGAHTGGANTRKIGILVMGDFQPQIWDFDDEPTGAQISKVKSLVNSLKEVFPTLKYLGGHRDYGETKCPGDKLYKRLDEIRKDTGLNAP